MVRRKDLSLEELGGLFKEGLTRSITRPTIHGYKPHDKQIQFHTSNARGRLYIGGNRSGKTVGGVVEDIWWLRGQHPYRPVPNPPVRGRIVTVSYIEGIQKIVIPELTRWIPPSDLKNGSWEDSYSKQERTLTLSNGSTVELMSYDQGLEKFAGTSRHFTHFDEEPPKSIFDECRMRLLDTGGDWWLTMTPVEGMTWVYDTLYLPGLVPGGNIDVIKIDTAENPYISTAEIENAISGLDENEKKARKRGEFVQIGGRVYKEFSSDVHVLKEPIIPPHNWTHYASLDHGFNNPTCWLWHAVSPNGSVVTYDEIYANERIVADFAKEIHKRNSIQGRRPPEIYVGDPAIAQRNGQTGDSIKIAYTLEGIPIVLGNNNVHIGVNRMNQYLKQGRWAITSNCGNLIRELNRVRWKIYDSPKKRHDNNAREEIHKKDDHAPDSARYFFSLMPDLYIRPTVGNEVQKINDIVKEALSPVTPPVDFSYDTRLQTQRRNYEWVDEHMGGIW